MSDPKFKIVDQPIDATELGHLVRSDADGAVCVFLGVARKYSRGREVVHLEYEAYPEMAEKKLAEIGDELRVKFGVESVAIHHRTGVLKIGEASVGIAVATPHRAESFQACQYAIDRLKQIVPIWKKEVWSTGEQWIGWEGQPPAGTPAPAANGQSSAAQVEAPGASEDRALDAALEQARQAFAGIPDEQLQAEVAAVIERVRQAKRRTVSPSSTV